MVQQFSKGKFSSLNWIFLMGWGQEGPQIQNQIGRSTQKKNYVCRSSGSQLWGPVWRLEHCLWWLLYTEWEHTTVGTTEQQHTWEVGKILTMPLLYIICLVSVKEYVNLYSSSCYFCFHPSPFLHKAILMNSILFSLAKNKWPQQFYLLIWNVVYFAFLLQQSFPFLNSTQARSFRDEAGRGDHGWGLPLGRGLGRAQPRLRRCDHSGGVRVCSSLNRGWPGGGSKKPIASPPPPPKKFF